MRSTTDAGDRLAWLWTGFFAATLGTGAVVGALSADGSVGFRLVPLLGAAVLLALDAACGRLAPEPEALARRQLAVALGWYAASLALLVPLVETYPAFSLAVYGFVPRIFTRLPLRPAVVAATLVLPALILGQGGLSAAANAETWYASLGSGLLSVLIGVFITAIARQSAQRREAVEALTAAQAEIAAQAHRAGVAEERGRLAREIHDTLAQGLVSVLTQIEAAERARGTAAGAHHLDLAREAARAALDDARRSVQALRPASLQDAPSLPAAMQRVAGRWSQQSGVAAEVSVVGTSRPLAPEVEVTLLRAAQEGLANVARHAGATRATVTLSYDGDEVAVDVDDDGAGFDPAALGDRPARDGGGFGIEALRQRARALGGSAHVESEPGRGATLVLRVPAHPAEEVVPR